jgi:anti-sigma regulatory factor (Ser/Thr protein kinase)
MSGIVKEFTLANEISALSNLTEQVERFGEEAGLPMSGVFKLNLVLDELVTNVIKYGGMAPEEGVWIRLAREGNSLVVEIKDTGRPFNPLEAEAPDTDCEMYERDIGGLGIHLTRKCMDEMHYERREGENYLRMRRLLDRECSTT